MFHLRAIKYKNSHYLRKQNSQFLIPSSGAHNSIHSFWYCQPMLLLAAVVDEMELHLIHDSSQQQ